MTTYDTKDVKVTLGGKSISDLTDEDFEAIRAEEEQSVRDQQRSDVDEAYARGWRAGYNEALRELMEN